MVSYGLFPWLLLTSSPLLLFWLPILPFLLAHRVTTASSACASVSRTQLKVPFSSLRIAWDFVDEVVAPADEDAAEKLSIALDGKAAERRFKDTLHHVDDRWLQAWYEWKDKRLKAAVEEWLESVL